MPIAELPTTSRPRITSAKLVETADRIQRAIQHAAIRLQDFSVGDAVPHLQEAGEHALTLHAMVAELARDIDATRVRS